MAIYANITKKILQEDNKVNIALRPPNLQVSFLNARANIFDGNTKMKSKLHMVKKNIIES